MGKKRIRFRDTAVGVAPMVIKEHCPV